MDFTDHFGYIRPPLDLKKRHVLALQNGNPKAVWVNQHYELERPNYIPLQSEGNQSEQSMADIPKCNISVTHALEPLSSWECQVLEELKQEKDIAYQTHWRETSSGAVQTVPIIFDAIMFCSTLGASTTIPKAALWAGRVLSFANLLSGLTQQRTMGEAVVDGGVDIIFNSLLKMGLKKFAISGVVVEVVNADTVRIIGSLYDCLSRDEMYWGGPWEEEIYRIYAFYVITLPNIAHQKRKEFHL